MTAVHFIQPQPGLTRRQLMSAVLDRRQMEQRRREAVALLKQGVSQSETARRMYVSRTSVGRWVALLKQGEETLRSRRAPGRPSLLTPEQHQQIRDLYRANPGKWTCYKLRDLIYERFGVRYHEDRAGAILKQLRGLGRGSAA